MPRPLPLLLLALSLLAPRPAQADGLPDDIASALHRAGVPDSHIGLVIQDIDSATPALAHGEQRSLNPASIIKLLTTLAVLDTLGPAHTFKTGVLIDGQLTEGVLHGDLILRGGGDPALTPERFWLLLRELRQRGIAEIRGDVLIDDQLYAIERGTPSAFDDAPLEPYNAEPAALLVAYNTVALRLSPSDDGLAARTSPPSLPIDNHLTLSTERSCNGWQDSLVAERDGDRLRLTGVYPQACGDKSLWLNLMCPPATAAAYFNDLWRELGGRHDGQVQLGETPPTAVPLFEFASPPLAEIVRDTNKFSNNVMAKMLFLNLGVARFGGAATWDKADHAVRDWLTAKGLDFPELVLENGSGLSRIERLSAASVARLLIWAAGQPLYYEFAASLPALGQEGTQRRRLAGTPDAGRAWLKSGSLNGARNLAGYVLDHAGHRKAVVLLINYPAARQASDVLTVVIRHALVPTAP